MQPSDFTPHKLPMFLGLALLFMLAVCPYAAQAQTPQQIVQVDTAVVSLDISSAVEALEDPTGRLTLAEVRAPEHAGQFAPRFPSGNRAVPVYWARVVLQSNDPASRSFWLDTGTQTPRQIDFYAPDAQGLYRQQSASSALPFSARPLPIKNFVFPVELQPDQPTTVYMRVQGNARLSVIRPEVWKPEALLAKVQADRIEWFFYLGVAAAIILYNLLLFFSLRDFNYFAYVLASLGIVWAVSSGIGGFGFAFETFWPDSPKFEFASWGISLAVSHLLTTYLFSRLLEVRQRMPGLHKWLVRSWTLFGLTAGSMLLILAFGTLSSVWRWLLLLGVVFGAWVGLIVLNALVRAARARNRTVGFIAAAWLPLFVVTIPYSPALVTGSPIDGRYLMWASAFQMLMMSLLLADRFNQEKREKVQAQATLVEGLLNSERELEGKVALRTQELKDEQARTKDLLHNILPVDVADELASTGTARPARHESVSILFTDFSGFTNAVSTMPADRMVAELNEVFAAFDDITDACGVEKIKTIGDAYMAASGLPKPCTDHAQRCVRAALLMLAYLERRNQDAAFKWQLRVGVHSGPVVAGVVGKRKYAFDIWGDTVNVAARMESSGEVGRVNVSAYTYDLIRAEFDCEYRGRVDAKGKGQIDMYFVKEARPDDEVRQV